jgi:hypothetical protein
LAILFRPFGFIDPKTLNQMAFQSFGFIDPKTLNQMAFQSFGFERTW